MFDFILPTQQTFTRAALMLPHFQMRFFIRDHCDIYCPEMQGFRVDFLSLVRLKNGIESIQDLNFGLTIQT